METNNKRNLIDNFIRPLAQRLKKELRKIDGGEFVFYKTEIGLAENPKYPMDAFWIHPDPKFDEEIEDLESHILKTQLVRIDFLANGKTSDTLAFVNIFTDIVIEESAFYIKALKKRCKYEDLPDLEIQNELFECYKSVHEQVAFDPKPRVIKLLN